MGQVEQPHYKRILLKLSGEALAGNTPYGIDSEVLHSLSKQIAEIYNYGVEIMIVVGGGNIWRGLAGSKEQGIERTTADYMGMLATVINCLALQDSLEKLGIEAVVQTSIEMRQVAEAFVRRNAERHLEQKRIIIFGAGTGNPFFSTDSTAALRASELKADVILMAKKVDGVYNADPRVCPDAKLYEKLSFLDILSEELGVMDSTAAALCKDNNVPIIVFNITEEGNIKRAVMGEKIGTFVGGEAHD